MPKITLRPASTEDMDFIFTTYRLALRHYTEWAWGWDEKTVEASFWRGCPCERFELVCADGIPAGAWYVDELADRLYLRLLFLHPDFQRQGIGTWLLGCLTDAARRQGKVVLLRVIRINHIARRLYERRGFRVMREEAQTCLMQWNSPPGHSRADCTGSRMGPVTLPGDSPGRTQ